MKIWFSADHHFGHRNILKYCNRPFATIQEMDEALVSEWNSVVRPEDSVFHLGDLSFKSSPQVAELFKQLNGWIRVLGNPWHHDARWQKISEFRGTILPPLVVLEGNKLGIQAPCIVLCHYPFAEWDRKRYGSYHLHGHCHNGYSGNGLIMDVGVDHAASLGLGYRPFSLDEVLTFMLARP